jgi:thermopsin
MRNSVRTATILIAFLLLSNAIPLVEGSHIGTEITIPKDYFEYIPLDAPSSHTFISYSTSSNVSVSTAIMDSSQFNAFNSSSANISNAMHDQNGTKSSYNVTTGVGTYYLVIYAYSSDADVKYNYTISPNSPYANGPLTPPMPTGVASFGLYNVSGNIVPYVVKSTELVGSANISAIQAYNATASQYNDTSSGATLQLNAMLVLVGTNGTKQVYWIQNTPDFVTNSSVVSYTDNVWNNTDVNGFLSNSSVNSKSGGYVYTSNDTQQQYYYAYSTANYSYSLPFDISLVMNESVVHDAVNLDMGIAVLRNGTSKTYSFNWFDNIAIADPGVSSAYFYTSGNESTPINTFYDTELVFGGEGNGESTHFTAMNSTLGLYFYNDTSRKFSSFPSYYTFGGDTAEGAYNLKVSKSSDGSAAVTIGTPDYSYFSTSYLIGNLTLILYPPKTPQISHNPFIILGLVVIIIIFSLAYIVVRRKPVPQTMPTPPP